MTDQQTWTHMPFPEQWQVYKDGTDLSQVLASVLLDVVQDGVCIINLDMEVVYSNVAMKYWYEGEGHDGAKCYERYHGRTKVCPDCPALRVIEQKSPQTSMQVWEKNKRVAGRQRLFCVPLLDAKGEVVMVVEYVRDITNEKMAESAALLLEKQNEVLKEHLEQGKEENKRREEETARRVSFVISSVKQSLSHLLDAGNYQRIEEQIDSLVNSFDQQEPGLAGKLTQQEMEVARYIMEGLVSKEIAQKLGLSKKTVDFHRGNIRKKMMLGPKDNLCQRLKEELY